MLQKEVINKTSDPCIILAGAGTGKTYTIVEKMKYLIGNKIYDPEKILCLTFSNEAANSLKSRIAPYVHAEPMVSTFHAFCADLLRKEGSPIGIKDTFKILLPDDAKILLHKNFKLHPRLCVQYVDSIGLAKDLGIGISDLENYFKTKTIRLQHTDLEKRIEVLQFELNTSYLKKSQAKSQIKDEMQHLIELIKIKKFLQAWKAYEKIKDRSNYLDYGDLNIKALELIKHSPNLKDKFQYIIVDEFQDTNKQQLELLKELSNKNITIVGDINQSIYQFRGAYKNVFSEFKEYFKVKPENIANLERSFRSPNTVLRTAHELIKNNYQNQNECFQVMNAMDKEGEKIQVIELKDEKEEARRALEIIEQHQLKDTLENLCVMFRTHQQARQLKTLLDSRKIPYQSVTKKPLFNLAYIKKALSYIIIAHKLDKKAKGGEHEWWTLLNSLNLESEDQHACNKLIKKNLEEKCLSESLIEQLQKLDISQESKEKLNTFLKNIQSINLKQTVPEIIKSVSPLTISETTNETEANLSKLTELAKESGYENDLDSFLYHLEIMQKIGINVESVSTEQKGLKIMTNHSTKGLEYKTVICCAFAQGKFPAEKLRKDGLIPRELYPEIKNMLSDVPPYAHEEIIEEFEEKAQLAEERRLCYVAFTRAKENLVILYAKQYGSKNFSPSRFLEEIKYKENKDITFTEDTEEKYAKLFQESQINHKTQKLALPKRVSFSPSALLLFTECKKRYEYKYVHNMPEKEPTSWEEINLGSFVHEVVEEGVNSHFVSEEQFVDLAIAKSEQENWRSVNLQDALPIIKVFFERNKKKYTSNSLTEVKLRAQIEGLNFEGYADRIDIHPDGIEIIDYKTGKSYITPKHRNWQLGLYAIGANSLNLGKVKKLTLDMLRHEKPYEFEVLDNGMARDKNSKQIAFNLEQVKLELVETAKEILQCYEKGFTPCSIEDNCEFCNENIWKI